MIQTAVVLVGGKGTRLAAKFPDLIKPLTPIGGQPFLEHLLKQLETAGLRRVILVSGDRSEQISQFLKKRKPTGVKVEELAEPTPLGTGGGLKFSEPALQNEETFLCLNGDTLFEGDLKPLLSFAVDAKNPAAVGVVEMPEVSRYGSVRLDAQDRILAFLEKGLHGRGFVNCGIYAFHKSIFGQIPNGKSWSIETQLLPGIQNLKAARLKGSFFDIGLPGSYASFNADVCLRELQQKHVGASLILANAMMGGKIFASPGFVEKYLSRFSHRNELGLIEIDESEWGRADERDLILVENPELDLLWKLNRQNGAQILAVTAQKIPQALCDLVLPSEKFDEDLKALNANWDSLRPSFGDFSRFEGELRPALFLDRDGVVIDHVHYIQDPKDVRLKKGIVDLLKRAAQKGWATVIITNQSGLGRGLFGWSEYIAVTNRMIELLHQEGAHLDFVVESPFYETSPRAKGLLNRHFRKPRPGMIKKAARELGLDLKKSVVIGDRATDIMTAVLAGVTSAWLVKSKSLDIELREWNEWELKSHAAWAGPVPETDDFQEILAEGGKP